MKGLLCLIIFILGMIRFFSSSNDQTLSSESIKILKSLKNDINISFYFSRSALKSSAYGQEFNSLASKVRKQFQEVARFNSKVKLQYFEPEPFSEKYLEGISKGVNTLPIKDNADLLFGVAFESSENGKTSTLNFMELGDERNLLRNIIKNLLLISKEKSRLYVYSTKNLFQPSSYKKTVLLSALVEWFDVELLKGNEVNLIPGTPILIIGPSFINETLFKFIRREDSKVIIAWDPYQLDNKKVAPQIVDLNLLSFLKNMEINLYEDDIVYDSSMAGKSFVRNSLIKKNIPFFLSCSKSCLERNNLSQYDRLDFVFPGSVLTDKGVSFFETSENSGLVKAQEVKSLNFYSDFLTSLSPDSSSYSVVSKYDRFLIFNDIDFLSERFMGIRDGENFFFENDNLNFFMSLINREVFNIMDPFSIRSNSFKEVTFTFYDKISDQHLAKNQNLMSNINAEIRSLQSKIINLEASMLSTDDPREREKETNALESARVDLRLKYQSSKLIEYSAIHQLESYRGRLKRFNYIFLVALFLLCLVVKRRLN